MNKKIFIKALTTLLIAVIVLFSFSNTKYADVTTTAYQVPKDAFELSAQQLLDKYAKESTGAAQLDLKTYEITADMVNNKTAIIIPYEAYGQFVNEAEIVSTDASALMKLEGFFYKDSPSVTPLIDQFKNVLSIDNVDDIEITITYKCDSYTQDSQTIPAKEFKLSSKTSTQADLTEVMGQLNQHSRDIITLQGGTPSTNEHPYHVITVKATVPNRNPYYLTLGKSGEYENRLYFVSQGTNFSTTLSYDAYVGTTNVGGTGTSPFLPNYDTSNPEKDADVTAIIKSEQLDVDIVSIGDVALSGTPNSLGWYYPNTNDKTKIAKVYKFDDYNNQTANGMVTEKDLVIKGSNGKSDTKTVDIKWPFRIIKKTQDPETITEETTKVRYEITTNLPIDPNSVPEGWDFTGDELGQSHHKIYIERSKSYGDYIKDIVLKANGRSDTVSTQVSIKFPDEKLPTKHAKTGEASFVIIAFVALASLFMIVKLRSKIK